MMTTEAKILRDVTQVGRGEATATNDRIPQEMRDRKQWLRWKLTRDGDKLPLQLDGSAGKSNDPTTWSEYEDVCGFDRFAYVISQDDPFTGIDLDNCFDDNGQLRQWATPIVNKLFGVAYGEISPSGRGIKFTTRAKKLRGVSCVHKFGPDKQQLECYDNKRFWTVTGNVYEGNTEIGDGQEAVDWICQTYLKKQRKSKSTNGTPQDNRSAIEDRAVKYLAKIPSTVCGTGSCDKKTFCVACILVRGFDLDSDRAFGLLKQWANRSEHEWTDDKLRRKIASAEEQDGERGYLLKGKGYSGLDTELSKLLASVEQGDSDELPAIWTPAGRTEAANAQRLIAKHAENFRWCGKWKKWLYWDGCRWIVDEQGRVEALAADIAHDLWREVGDTLPNCDDKTRRELLGFAKTSNGGNGVREMLFLARSNPLIAISPGDMDADTWLLNCPNGTVDLRTGKLRSHRREDKLTKLCPTPYNPDAESYHWDRFLESIFKDQSLIDFVQRLFGYSLTGDVREQLVAIFHGEGSNGKSTLLDAYMTTIGEDYSMQGKPDLLMANAKKSHATERMDLFGKRFVSCVETEDSHSINEAFVKALTGGEPIRGRRVYENPWQFNPTHKIILSTNHKPRIKGRDHGIWRRLCLVLFEVLFWDRDKGESGPPELECDKSLKQKLADEAEGILAWGVRGCLEWQAGGLRMPDIVKASTDEYNRNEDVIGNFLAACTKRIEGRTKFKTVYEALETWANDIGENLPSKKALNGYLTDMDYRCNTTGGTAYVYGLGVLNEVHHDDP